MKTCLRFVVIALLATGLLVTANISSFADTYHTTTFTGAISPGNANVLAPFTSVLTQGHSILGGFVLDNTLIPGAGTGFVNVFFSNFPDAANIPAATAFTINLGAPSLTFTLADADSFAPAAIQFNNGKFNGFFFETDFTFTDNKPYRFIDQGGLWSIWSLDQLGINGNPQATVVNGYINIGDANMRQGDVYTPPGSQTSVPEPTTMLFLGVSLFGFGLVGRKFKK
jgi:hypothetical protein